MVKKEAPADIEQPQSPSWVASSIKMLIDELPPFSECCIYRVPPHVRNLNESVYAPQVIAIGPFHHREPKLQRMGEHKLRYLRAFLSRVQSNLSLEDCENKIREWEKDIRASYDETFDLTHDEFVGIVLIDSCFVIEAILSDTHATFYGDTYVPKSNFLYDIDMMLLENQLPFFVLDRLYDLAFPDQPNTMFLECCIKYFFYHTLFQVDVDILTTMVKAYVGSFKHPILHFVDLLRLCHLPSKLRPLSKEPDVDLVTIPKVTEICESITKLEKSRAMPLDIRYESGVLEIPGVIVGESTKYLLSNILALEMCHYINDSYVRDYVFFMDMLIDTPKDVDLLIKKGIITNRVGDSDLVANFFNKVGYHFPIVCSNYYFYKASQDLNRYCKHRQHRWKRRRNRWKAAFKRDYCSTPWMIASTTAAVILLVLTFIQAICSIIQTKPSITSF